MITGSINSYLLSFAQLETLLQVCRILTYINSAINPYVYNITNSLYRQCFREAFCRKSAYNHGNTSSQVSSVSIASTEQPL